MPSYIPIEDRYRLAAMRDRQMHHTSLATLVIAGAVTSVAAAGASAAVSINSANQAARAQARAGGDYGKAVQNALNQYNQTAAGIVSAIRSINPNIKIPNYTLFPTDTIYKRNNKTGEILKDKRGNPIIEREAQSGAVLEGILASNIINENALRQIENVLPGSATARAQANQIATNWQTALEREFDRSKETYKLLESSRQVVNEQLPQLGSARAVVDKMIRGDLSEQAKQAITRTIAETSGAAGFSPEAARRGGMPQTAQAALSQNIMRDVEARQLRGLEAAQGITAQTLGIAGQLGTIGQQYGQTTQLLANVSEAARAWEGTRQSWQQLSNSFLTQPTTIMQIGLQGRGQDITKEQYGIQNALEQQRIQADMAIAALNASTGGAGAQYQASTGSTGARLAANQAMAQGISGVGSAVGSGLMAYGLAGQYSTAQPVTYGGQSYGSVAGYGGQTYNPQLTSSGGLAYTPASGRI